MKIDIVCPLFRADDYIDDLISGIQRQNGIELGQVVFAITNIGEIQPVINKIDEAGFDYFLVEKKDFSHSLTREKALKEYCSNDIVVMISQDVHLIHENAMFELASAINDEVVYAYGKQICRRKTIEYYIRKRNYGETSAIISKDDVEKLQLKAFFASDAFSAYHRSTFIQLGGYDSVHMMMSEDMYYAKKVLDAGYRKAYVATAVVEHSHKFTLKQLYNRYYATGVWFSEHPEFDAYHATDSGIKLAFFVLGQALKHFNIPVLIRWLPDMIARYLGMRKGKNTRSRQKVQV